MTAPASKPEWDGTLRIDIETWSSVDLTKSGVYKYVQAPDFAILLFGARFNGEIAGCIDLTNDDVLPERIVKALYDPRILKLAWNASFEIACISEHLVRRGMAPLDPTQWRCTMIRAAMIGLPLKLSEAGKAARVDLDAQKDSAGRALVRYFCIPCKPTVKNGQRTRNLPHHDPAKWQDFIEYCRQDVVSEAGVDDAILEFPVDDREWARWHQDVAINGRGVQVDLQLVRNAIAMSAAQAKRDLARLAEITGVKNPKSVAQLKAWLEATDGELTGGLTKDRLPDLIAGTDNEAVKEALYLRQQTSKSSIKKYEAMERAAGEDGRVRGLLQFYGASRTGREAGRLVQVQNLKSNTIEDLDMARELLRAGDAEGLQLFFGPLPDTLSQLVRTAIIPAPGNKLVAVDFSAIEARVLAWLAWEEWRLEVFRTHGLLYEASASKMFNVPMEDFLAYKAQGKKHPLRKKGKVTELACGFMGSVGALKKMGALDEGMEESELQPAVAAWRAASPRISSFSDESPGLWQRVGRAAFRAVKSETATRVECGDPARPISIRFQVIRSGARKALYCWLPSGRPLIYWNPSIRVGGKFDREVVCYEGYTERGPWGVIDSYAGKFVENIVQGIARDLLFGVIDQLEEVVFHVHDEPVLEFPEMAAGHARAHVEMLMSETPDWAPGLPLAASGEILSYYRKGD